jgi:hypothetical protein
MARAAVATRRKPLEFGLNGVAGAGTGLAICCSQRFLHSVGEELMIRKSILAVTTLALLGSPLASYADAADQALDACVQAFVAAKLPKGQPVVVDKRNSASGPLDIQTRTYRIVLTATGTSSGRQVAKSTCVANRAGQVIALNGRRPPQPTAATVATNEIVQR